ncbi:MAG: hypothetical protein R3F58_09765 [Steroidobacteraceae bacterium]
MVASPAVPGAWAWLGQAVLYALFATVIGVFSQWPTYQHLQPGVALIKLSLVHTGKLVGDCRQRSAEELAALPPNMRAASSCPRERSPVIVELDIDGVSAVRAEAAPSGLSRDGASAIYARLPVDAGDRLIAVRMKDDVRSDGFDYRIERHVSLQPAQVLVIDFDAEAGGITLR